MTADDLRAVAAEIREKANAATPGPWLSGVAQGRAYLVEAFWMVLGDEIPKHRVVAEVPGKQTDAKHIIAWHPAVALAVADWLESELDHPFGPPEHAIAFCKAWRGES